MAIGDSSQNGREVPAKDEVDIRFELLCTLGQTVEATSSSMDVDNKQPDFFDEQRFKKAQATCKKYYTSVSVASTVGLILLLQIESILIPLLKTGRSRTVVDLYDRYSATTRYVRKYYESNIYDKSSEGWRYIKLVRMMHQRVYKLMNDGVDGKGPTLDRSQALSGYKSTQKDGVWVNQYDMAMTQFAFIGLFLLKPSKCAAYHITESELSDVVYYWRLLSYYFGIEDRFNLFVYHHEDGRDEDYNRDQFRKQIKLLNLVLEHQKEVICLAGTQSHVHNDSDLSESGRHPIGLAMGKGVILVFEDLATDLSFNILDHHWHPYVSISGKPEKLSLGEHIKNIKFFFTFKVLLRSDMLMVRISQKYRKKLDKWLANGEKNKKKLEKKYGHLIYELPNK